LALVASGAQQEAPHAGSKRGSTRQERVLDASGWQALFGTAFRQSRNPMLLADEHRLTVDANRAFAKLVHRRPSDVIGKPLYSFVRAGTELPEEEWNALIMRNEYVGDAEVVQPDGGAVRVHFAAHPELVTGRRLILIVTLSTHRAGRHFRRHIDHEHDGGPLSDREAEIVRLVALGETGPEIAEQLHISHNTVRTHIHNAMVKTGARSRAHLVAKAMGAGLVLS
jgi:DNA-binding CsgD family transcriptional regulator